MDRTEAINLMKTELRTARRHRAIRVSPRRRSPMAETATSRIDGSPSVEEQAREWSVAVNQAVTLAKQAGKAVHHQERFRSTRPNQIWALAFAAD